jgi:hypothetical protein
MGFLAILLLVLEPSNLQHKFIHADGLEAWMFRDAAHSWGLLPDLLHTFSHCRDLLATAALTLCWHWIAEGARTPERKQLIMYLSEYCQNFNNNHCIDNTINTKWSVYLFFITTVQAFSQSKAN